MGHTLKDIVLPDFTREQLQQLSKNQLIDIILLLQEQNRLLREDHARLEARVAELERRLGLNSTNSSKPPSSDPNEVKEQRPKKEPTGRKPGGQPGHQGHFRELVPVDQVPHLHKQKPGCCACCGRKLKGREDRAPQRFQWWEIPEIKPELHEVQVFSEQCDACGIITQANPPSGTPTGAFGPRLMALIATLTGSYRMSKRQAQRLLKDVLGISVSLGAISNSEGLVSEALAAPYQEAHAYVQQQAALNADETGWREKKKRAWLWVAVTLQVTVYMIHLRRSMKAAKALLGCFAGVLGSDRWAAYNDHPGLRQLCWAHLLRDFIGFSELGGKAGAIGMLLVDKTNRMFKWWHKIRDGTMSRAKFEKKMRRHSKVVERLLRDASACAHPKMAESCARILKEKDSLWTFVKVRDIEPTNNSAERAERKGVLWRKTSFGTESEAGSRFAERVLTATETCRQQGRNVLGYLTAACEALLHNRPAPSLLPLSQGLLI